MKEGGWTAPLIGAVAVSLVVALAVVLLVALGDGEAEVGHLLDVGHVVVLGDIDAHARAQHEGDATS